MKLGSDIVCILESHFAKDNSPTFKHHNFPHIFLSSNKKKKGVVTAIKDTVSSNTLISSLILKEDT